VANRALLPSLARRAAAVITVSQHAKTELVRTLNISPDKLHVIYEAPPPHFEPVHDANYLAAMKQKFALPDKYILYLGTLEPRKNLTRLVQAVSQLYHRGCEVPLLLAGPKGWHMSGFKEEISNLGLESMVHYLGYVPGEALPALYSLATVFAFPSLYEGFGLPPLEAMACGTPVLTSKASAMAEVGGDAVYLIDPYDIEAIADGLHRLLTDKPLRQELSQRGRQHARQFSWERAARETTAVYRQVLQGIR
jgi:glycosyltransferase involved in cell wall biosynthesis